MPEKRSVKVVVRLTPTEKKNLEAVAALALTTTSTFCRQILMQAVQAAKKKD